MPGPTLAVMTRDELILRTRQLIAEGERLDADPSLTALQTWIQLSDDLLATAWGSMDRYHLAWLMVGKPKEIIRGRPMTDGEEAAYVREVAAQKTAALRMSLDAVDRQGMPFFGESGGIGAGQGMGEGCPNPETGNGQRAHATASGSRRPSRWIRSCRRGSMRPGRTAAEHPTHDERRAPRPGATPAR